MNTVATTHLLSALLLLSFIFTSCQDSPKNHQTKEKKIIHGRNSEESLLRPATYQVITPISWHFQESDKNLSLLDTTLPLAEFMIQEKSGTIHLTIHNFPTSEFEKRIPPVAQVNRWKEQLGGETARHTTLSPQAFGGYAGIKFEGEGMFKGKEVAVIGWSMQLSPEHFYALSQPQANISSQEREQMRADYTIKAVGPIELIQAHQDSIHKFARSFHLIKPIPKKR